MVSLRFLNTLALIVLALPGAAGEPLIRRGDTVAFIGGTELGGLSEPGEFEARLVRGSGAGSLRVRDLAWEGDTVFEQARELNFPPLEAQLEKVAATVVVAQFGKMEALGSANESAAARGRFAPAYAALLDRLGAGAARRLVLVSPAPLASFADAAEEGNARIAELVSQTRLLAQQRGAPLVDVFHFFLALDPALLRGAWRQDGVQLSEKGQRIFAALLAEALLGRKWIREDPVGAAVPLDETLRALVAKKNRLWFHYWRPQNWAFLNGDRTSQPSSRDHRDPSKRWFPAEIEEFVPLIEAREAEIAQRVTELSR